MRAVVQRKYGGPEVLSIAEIPQNEPGAEEIEIRVHASQVHRGNAMIRSGRFPGFMWLPMRAALGFFGPRKRVPGSVFAGRIERVGARVSRFEVGHDVVGVQLHGGHAETVLMPESGIVARKPEALDYAQAVALPYGGTTAHYFLHDLGALQPGQRVLVIGASGGVGQGMVQVATAHGAQVTAVCTPKTESFVRSLGAGEVIDRTATDVTSVDARFDVIVDTANVARFPDYAPLLTENGILLGVQIRADLLWWAWRTRGTSGKRVRTGMSMGDAEILAKVLDLGVHGQLQPNIAARFPLQAVAEAHRAIEAGAKPGAVILEPQR